MNSGYNLNVYEGSGIIFSESYSNDAETALSPDNWAVSPAFDLTEAGEDVIVSLYAMGQDSQGYDKEHIFIYAGTSSDPAEMVPISDEIITTHDWTQYTASLADFIGESEVYVAIRHTNITDMFIVNVDKVEIMDDLTEVGPVEPDPAITGNVIFEEDFEVEPSWTFVDSDGDGYNWTWAGPGYFETNPAYSNEGIIYSASYINNLGALTPDNWMISPAIDLSDAADDVIVSIYAKGQDPSWAGEHFAIYAGTSADPNNMVAVLGETVATGDWTQYTASLADYAGEDEVYIAVRHFNITDMFYLDVDLVQVMDNLTEGDSIVQPAAAGPMKEARASVSGKSYQAREFHHLGDGFVPDISVAPETFGFGVEIAKTSAVGASEKVVGSTNAFTGVSSRVGKVLAPVDETTVADGTVSIVLTEDEAVTNGLITITYNADELTYVDTVSELPYKSVSHEIYEPAEGEEPALRTGVITFAYASVDEIPAEEILATLNFTYEGEIDTTVVVTTLERNDDVAVEEDPLVIELKSGHDCPCKDFEDMPEYGTPEHEAIDWAFTNGITKGVSATQFGVGKTLTRAQAATFLYAAAGKPEFDETAAENPFSDVPEGTWYTKPVLWAASQGFLAGYSDGTFKPNGTLSRAQILVILYAQAGKPDVSGYENPYTDVPDGKWFTNPALWAYYAGIERGEDGVFAQSTPCTREVFVLYLYRYMTGNCLLGDE